VADVADASTAGGPASLLPLCDELAARLRCGGSAHGIVSPDGAVLTVPIGARLTAGRNADIAVPHPYVSREHVAVWVEGAVLLAVDLGSRNGTFVHRDTATIRVGSDACVLLPGDVVATTGRVTLFEVGAR
jgi:hypothetical protein